MRQSASGGADSGSAGRTGPYGKGVPGREREYSANRYGSSETGVQIRIEAIDKALRRQENGSAAYTDFRGEPVRGVYRWLPDLGVAMLVEQDRSEASLALLAVVAVTGAVALAAVLIALFAALSVTRGIASPLADLAATANQIAAGNLDLRVRAPARTRSEWWRPASTACPPKSARP